MLEQQYTPQEIRILASLRTTDRNHYQPTFSASSQWQTAVSNELSKGLPPAKAVMAANRAHPGLRERMLAEVNSGRAPRPTVSRPTAAPAVASFGSAVQSLVDAGWDRVLAVNKVKAEQPHLLARLHRLAGLG
jgi:hypothetical protein